YRNVTGVQTCALPIFGDHLPTFLIAPFIFLAAGAISFTTGTSWGTFALMIPIGIPLALDLGLSTPLLLSALIGGGVFGDHCSPKIGRASWRERVVLSY